MTRPLPHIQKSKIEPSQKVTKTKVAQKVVKKVGVSACTVCKIDLPESLDVQWLGALVHAEAKSTKLKEDNEEREAVAWVVMNRHRYLVYLDKLIEYMSDFVKEQTKLLSKERPRLKGELDAGLNNPERYKKQRDKFENKFGSGGKVDSDNGSHMEYFSQALGKSESDIRDRIQKIDRAVKGLQADLNSARGAVERAYEDFGLLPNNNSIQAIISNGQYGSYEGEKWKHSMVKSEKNKFIWQMMSDAIVKDRWFSKLCDDKFPDGQECDALRRALKVANDVYIKSNILQANAIQKIIYDPMLSFSGLDSKMPGLTKDATSGEYYVWNRTAGHSLNATLAKKPAVVTIGGNDFFIFKQSPAHLNDYHVSKNTLDSVRRSWAPKSK